MDAREHGEYFVTGEILPEAYHNALLRLHKNGAIYPCTDWNTEQKEISLTMVVENPTEEPMISKLFIGGPRELEQYRQEMLDGILDFEIAKGNWAYTYHDRITHYSVLNGAGFLNQIDFVIQELTRNPDSRRAVITVRDTAVDVFGDDPACLQHIQYFVRDGKLHCKVLFRSNDACKATLMNTFALVCLQKRIADDLGVPVGTYTLRANSFHCYAEDYAMLEGYCNRIESAKNMYDVAVDYIGDWEEMMEEYKPEIAELVAELAAR